MIIHNPPKMTLIHKKSGRKYYITENTYYLDYDETKFIVQQYQNKLI